MTAPTPLQDRFAQPEAFVVAAEIVTSRGALRAEGGKALGLARELATDPRIDALSITDNPGGHAMLAPDALGTDLMTSGQEVIIHLACKDWNRNALESRGWQLASAGFNNVLALSGDYPVTGHDGLAAPVFDIDSVGLLNLFSEMNGGLRDERTPDTRLERTDFFLGCVVTNHKRHEREVVPQYLKLRKKARAGARFVINQIGYDTRKDDELLRWIRHDGLALHALANVYLLSPAAARVFNRGKIPGVVVSDELLAARRAPRRGPRPGHGRSSSTSPPSTSRSRAGSASTASTSAGTCPPPPSARSSTCAETFAGDWQQVAREIRFPLDGEFYLFEPDPETGLSSDELSASYLESKRRRKTDLRVPIRYRVSRRVHDAVFADDAPLFPAGAAFYRTLERAPRPVRTFAHGLEHAAKLPMFGCRDCGDCSLPDVAYVCPESQCAKNQRNGPCGGTRDGLCEVYDSECIWSQAYERLKAYGEEEAMLDGPVVVKDNALARTSAWSNAFLGRDHNTRQRGSTGEDQAG